MRFCLVLVAAVGLAEASAVFDLAFEAGAAIGIGLAFANGWAWVARVRRLAAIVIAAVRLACANAVLDLTFKAAAAVGIAAARLDGLAIRFGVKQRDAAWKNEGRDEHLGE